MVASTIDRAAVTADRNRGGIAKLKAWGKELIKPVMAAMACSLLAAPAMAKEPALSLVELGERLYKQGIGTSGKPVAAIDLSGQKVYAPSFHCVSCHRKSGFGSKEGGVYIPPISAPVLYAPMKPDRARSFNGMFFQQKSAESSGRIFAARTRPAYDLASLTRLLRTGIDSAGQPVPNAMPRFELSSRDIAALDAWLRTLSVHPDPGVDDKSMRFAVVVSDRISEATRKSLLETTRVHFERFNKTIANDRSRPNFSPFYRSGFASFWREWTLDVWELRGPEATWPQQLAERYAASPVFAVIGGAVGSPWAPVGAFCDREKVPCIFPITDLPARENAEPGYTLYSYGGLPLEARVLAQFLAKEGAARRVIQLAVEGPRGDFPAATFAEALPQVLPGSTLKTVVVPSGGWPAALAAASSEAGSDGVLVLWPGDDAAVAVTALGQIAPPAFRIFLPGQAEPAAVAALSRSPMTDRLRVIHPTEMPSVVNPHSYRVRAWLNARRVAFDPPEEQFQVYYALSVLEKAVMEIQGDYSRDYLIEQIEMIAESNLSPGVFPNLTLGPGQRVASRGGYVVRLDPAATGGIRTDGDWLVP